MSTDATWQDPKRYLWLIALTVPLFPFLAWGLATVTGLTVAWFIGPLFIFVVIPLLDLWRGIDQVNPPTEVLAELEADKYYRYVTYAFLPLQYAGLVVAVWLATSGQLGWVAIIGLAATVGLVGGVAINTAHELGHKHDKYEQVLAKIALAQSGYGHFFVEHNRGHHVRVATPQDPASARLGESVYRFLPRTILGGYKSAWQLEKKKTRGKPFTWRNDILQAWALTFVLWAALVLMFGWWALPFLIGQALVAMVLLEIVNYVEHYGLLRQQVTSPQGAVRYEPVAQQHSWNNDNIATNVLLYHLQRHSDHHANPRRRYQALRSEADAPTLPTGYAGMIVLSLIPFAWFRVMDPRVLAHYSGDLSRAHRMLPSK